MNDPKTKSLFGTVMEGLKDTNNIGDIATKLVSAVGAISGQQQQILVLVK